MQTKDIKTAILLVVVLLAGVGIGWFVKPTTTAPTKTGKFSQEPTGQVNVIVGLDAGYPPWSEVAANGTIVGVDIDICNWIAHKYNWTLEYKPWDWATIWTALVSGDVDLIISGGGFTAERAESGQIGFVLPYYSVTFPLMVLRNDNRTKMEILNSGGSIAVQVGTGQESTLDTYIAAGMNFQKLPLDSFELGFQAVLDGRAVAMVSETGFNKPYFIEKPDMAIQFKDAGSIGGTQFYSWGTRIEDLWLRNQLNYALQSLMATPYWDEIQAKWNV